MSRSERLKNSAVLDAMIGIVAVCALAGGAALAPREAWAFNLFSYFSDREAEKRAELVQKLVPYFTPAVRTLSRDIKVYHWTGQWAVGLNPETHINNDPQPESARKFLRAKLHEKEKNVSFDAAGSGLYAAIDAAVSRSYGGVNPAVVEFTLKSGLRFVDDRWFEEPVPESLQKELKSAGCGQYENLSLFVTHERKCTALVQDLFRALRISAIGYEFAGTGFWFCRAGSRSTAFVLIDPALESAPWQVITLKDLPPGTPDPLSDARQRVLEMTMLRGGRRETAIWARENLFQCSGDPSEADSALQAARNLDEMRQGLMRDVKVDFEPDLWPKIEKVLGESREWQRPDWPIDAAKRGLIRMLPKRLQCSDVRTGQEATCSMAFQNADLITAPPACELALQELLNELEKEPAKAVLGRLDFLARHSDYASDYVPRERLFVELFKSLETLLSGVESSKKWDLAFLAIEAVFENRLGETASLRRSWLRDALDGFERIGKSEAAGADRKEYEQLVRKTIAMITPEIATDQARLPVNELLAHRKDLTKYFLDAENQERYKKLRQVELCLNQLPVGPEYKKALAKEPACSFLR